MFRSEARNQCCHSVLRIPPRSGLSDTYFNIRVCVCFFILESYSDQNGKSSEIVGLHLLFLYQTETSRAAY